MQQKVKEIMDLLDTIEYGFKDSNNKNIFETNKTKWDKEFNDFYYLQTPEELLKSKCGVCWDQVELERKLFNKENIEIATFFICTYDNDNLPSHTFLTYKYNDKYYWFEHSWAMYKGIHEYNNILELLKDVKAKHLKEHNYVANEAYTFIYKYNSPKFHIGCNEFYSFIETQELIKVNDPLYFYHLVNKDADMTNGLISLQYMYDNKMFDLFDKNVLKYKNRILHDWQIKKYVGKNDLTREEYIDALNIFRGMDGSNYIYFFRYSPYKALGRKIMELSKYKDIYRININDEELQQQITDIFYGFDMSNSNNKVLDKNYYENISKKEYFAQYDDSLALNFSTLNHIGVSFKNGNCPLKYLEKVDWQ